MTSCRPFALCSLIIFFISVQAPAMFGVKHHFSDEAPASPRIMRHASLPPALRPDEPAPLQQEDLALLKELEKIVPFSEQVRIAIYNDCAEDLFLSIKDPFGNDYCSSLIIKAGHEISFEIMAGAPLLLKAMPHNQPNPKFYECRIDNNFNSVETRISTWTAPILKRSPLRFASHQNVLTSPSTSATSSPRSSSPALPNPQSHKRVATEFASTTEH